MTPSTPRRTWTGTWITHPDWSAPDPGLTRCPVLRREFDLTTAPDRAVLHIVAAGVWAVTINGLPLSDAVLEPGMTEFNRRIAWIDVDITHLLQTGSNTIMVELGEGSAHVRPEPGRYTKFTEQRVAPRALINVDISNGNVNGNEESIVTDSTWTAALGMTTLAHWFGGEDVDARLTPSDWVPAVELGTADTGPEPWRRQAPPVRVVDRLGADEIARPDDAVVTLDFGRNFAGRQVLHLADDFPAGVRVEMWPAEYVDATGRVDQRTTGSPIFDSYISAGGPAVWHPQFCYHGFRFLEVRVSDATATGAAGRARPDLVDRLTMSAEQLMTDNPPAGTFRCSDETLNGIYTLVSRAVQSNFYSVPTDCPHREKLGWLEQLHLVFEPVAHLYQVHDHLSDMITHMVDAQTPEGLIPDITPELVVFDGGFRDDVNWGGAIWLLPWHLYRAYATLEPARRAWDAGVRYLDYLDTLAGVGILDHGLGDWITLDDSTPRPLVAGFGHVQVLRGAAALAQALGRQVHATQWSDRAAGIAEMIKKTFVTRDAERIRCGSDSQASRALVLDLDVLDADEHAAVLADLISDLERTGHQITVGEIALPSLVRTLTAAGRHDVWHRVATQLDGPSYGRMLHDDCTALAEAWSGAESGISANHLMLGYVTRWLTGSVGGLSQSTGSVGWDHVEVAPVPVGDVRHASVSYPSRLGTHAVDWRIDDHDVLTVTATLPDSGTGSFTVPVGWSLPSGATTVELGPGRHEFRLRRG